MTKDTSIQYGLEMGALSDDIEDQLQRQGLTLGSIDSVRRVQGWADAITSLGIQELLTMAERDKARKRLMKRISTLVQRKQDSHD
jgi:hypothetical protein